MEITEDPRELAKELGPAAETPIGPMIGVASIALNMAMKYHDINTIQDGALYQQYKLEGRNIGSLHIDMVFETAIQIEKHLIGANKRVTEVMIASLAEFDEAVAAGAGATENPPAPTATGEKAP